MMGRTRRTLGMMAAGLVGAACAGAPYLFAYAAGLSWFSDRQRSAPHSGEFFTLESFAAYGIGGFPVFMAGGAALFVWLIFYHRPSRAP
jgi:hypothetical protein